MTTMRIHGRKLRPWVVYTINVIKGMTAAVMAVILFVAFFVMFFGAVFQEQDKLVSMQLPISEVETTSIGGK